MGPEELYDFLIAVDQLNRTSQVDEARELITSSPLGPVAIDRGYLVRSDDGFELTKVGRTLIGRD